MGFGYGNGATHNDSAYDRETGAKVAKTFDNSMCAHVWAQYTQTFGQSNNGNLFFRGRALHSYGSHFVAGYLLPSTANLESAGAGLINADSYSVSTSGHISDARAAVRGRSYDVPNLTDLAQIFEDGLRAASPRLNPGCYPAEYGPPNRKALARYAAPLLKQHFSKPDSVAALSAMNACFLAAGCDAPERRAMACEIAAARETAKQEKEAAANKHKDALRDLAETARAKPALIASRMESDARAHAPNYRTDSDYGPPAEWRNKSKRIFRALKAGKIAGRTRQCEKARAVRKAINDNMFRFEAAAIRRNRVKAWRREVSTLRVALGDARPEHFETEKAYRGRGGPNRNGPALRAYELCEGAGAAKCLAAYLGQDVPDSTASGLGMAAVAARVAGNDPEALAGRLMAIAGRLTAESDTLEKEGERLERLAELHKLQAIKNMPKDGPAETRLNTIKRAETVAGKYASRLPYSWEKATGRVAGHYAVPGAWRLAGWTPDKFAAVADYLKGLNAAVSEEIAAEKAELARIAKEEESKARAMAIEMWQRAEKLPAELSRLMPRAMPDGSAYIRAVGVERDAAGAITGGELETSQGASVPLPHAIKAFRFLKACRDAGKEWHANGRTLRVGHFAVDKVNSDGGFVAGCHKFAWPEIARLAASLDVLGIAPADTTERREHA